MSNNDVQVFLSFLTRYRDDPQFASLASELENIKSIEKEKLDQLLSLYNRAIPLIENNIWAEDYDDDLFLECQSLFREMERHIAKRITDPESIRRHHFVIVIPVADRPQHLRTCLESIYQLCECFQYGGKIEQSYKNVSVIIADDSQGNDNIYQHRELAERYTNKGLRTEYFGLEEQIQQVQNLKKQDEERLTLIIGDFDHHVFYHKGASLMRNIAYLRLNKLAKEQDNTLFYFIDSDQEFKINIPSQQNKDIVGLNYFYHLDRLFSEKDIKMLTGKVVGDPPVSPAVMAGNFLNDVTQFLEAIASYPAKEPCQFHNTDYSKNDDAAYHDMADLFGYKKNKLSYDYACPLAEEHDHLECFRHFANQLNHFFDGEHPTRRMYFQYENIIKSVTPARTVYTGNYIFKPEMLDYFIPFAPLKLRMAGPVLGRLIRTEIGNRFVSANLPMLHKRTVEETGQSEYRPGIKRQDSAIDLSAEFERQFFGDVMLFTIDDLTEQGYPAELLSTEKITTAIKNTEERLLQRYRKQHTHIKTHLRTLTSMLNNQTHWWNNENDLKLTLLTVKRFIDNMTFNFGNEAKAYQRIQNDGVRDQYRQRILDAIISYPDSKRLWQQNLKRSRQDKHEYIYT